ncbi:Exodeoxyribonuclease V, gamma subunit [Candidatus Accumulibacter aalborgensis]|uniref:RecBCD enzyme subunit RecC n=1 Tax=Candidatus Accumulibacter aalborgensis TaxID=1860102 RepID=A0A1A8XUZ9_9PROT|nr:exodeoxyribonuclease V subunit gamma [Candidatus Accumulibacter aalborgensis]SBT08849.1 Exodeoxyribonuclease V, gamma subunit [Candidatus Accumulibacter aalborgensis]
MFRITFSNRFEFLLEALLDRLSDEVCSPGRSPFATQQVIVPSMAIRRRVELACADRHGICANIDFSYLAQWLWTRIGELVAIQEVSPFAPALLAWRVFEILADSSFTDSYPRLARYLRDTDPVMRLDLAQRCAQLIEHYITYRPQWLAAWSEGKRAHIPGIDAGRAEDELWQAALWRRITSELGTARQHPAVTFFQTIESQGSEAAARECLPASASVFCLTAMPPLYLDILRQLSRWIDIQVYALNPCREYWFDIVDQKRLGYLAARDQDSHHEVGNALLAAWGKQSQAHIELLFAEQEGIVEEDSLFLPASGDHLLARLQNAILDLHELEPGSFELAADDRSIEVHVCHSLTRELEVLHDQLLAQLASAEPPAPEQIVVVLPDLKAAAPLIDAVFGTAPVQRRIPYTITGLPPTRVNPVARVLDTLLSLCSSRFAASAVFDLLQEPPVAAKFDLEAADLDLIHGWIRDAGIRWGLDAESRRRLNLPASERHSFADGLHRLFLAYALGDSPLARNTVVAGRIAAASPEGSDAATLGRFWRFVDALEELRDDWSQPRDASAWQRSLSDALGHFTRADDDLVDELRVMHAAINELHANMVRGGARAPLPLAVVHSALTALLDDPGRGGVPGGGLIFSSLTGLRALPYRVVCLLGMNDGAFPSVNRPAEFDLMALQPQPGDRQRRLDERNLFLDLVLAARQRLYLSYSGRSIRDNSLLPPSVLVAELIDYAAAACANDPTDAASIAALRRRLTVEHPLQAFSAEYFLVGSDPRRRSFNAEYCQALQQGLAAAPLTNTSQREEKDSDEDVDELVSEATLPFFASTLAPPPDEWRQVSLDQLLQFFANPCRMLLAKRLNVSLAVADEDLQDEEPFLPDYPGRQALSRRVLPALLASADDDQVLPLALAGNEFPPGPLGERLIGEEVARLRAFAAELQPQLAATPLPAVHAVFDYPLDGENWQLAGALGDLRPEGLLRYRYDEVRPADYLAGWITHLFLCAAAPVGVRRQTCWHSRDGSYHLTPCEAATARARLGELLHLYRRGLSAPLHFFPKSAWAYVSSGDSLTAARKRWRNSRNAAWGEEADPAYRLALRGLGDPLDAAFEQCASTVFGPLLAYLDDSRR